MSQGKTRVLFDADGLEGQWAEVANIGTKSPRQFKALKQLPKTTAELEALPEEEALEAARQFLALVVDAWNVKADGVGLLLPAPTSPDLDPDAVPTIVSARIKAEIEAQMEYMTSLKAPSRRA
jgi:hypothetical protein